MGKFQSNFDVMEIEKELRRILPENRIRTRYIDLVSFASDAGFYHLVPKAVVQPVSEDEIIELFKLSHRQNIPLVFRGEVQVSRVSRSLMVFWLILASIGTGYK